MPDLKGQEETEKAASREEPKFSVWQLDDNNNEFLVRGGLSEDEALELVREFEGRGHRQAYWVKPGSGLII
ncbi:MAG: hypothetical protein KUA37_18565 [Desulfomicrobium sp.]|nr:hypothetical protein [Desulfomicrobium sp.]MBV1718649.1 hypothetical protein [Desulfomicrobium sp.]MBV1747153.1 hypothetical protein [Desulfomicrobium sp.]